jgi:hypothetical protein
LSKSSGELLRGDMITNSRDSGTLVDSAVFVRVLFCV